MGSVWRSNTSLKYIAQINSPYPVSAWSPLLMCGRKIDGCFLFFLVFDTCQHVLNPPLSIHVPCCRAFTQRVIAHIDSCWQMWVQSSVARSQWVRTSSSAVSGCSCNRLLKTIWNSEEKTFLCCLAFPVWTLPRAFRDRNWNSVKFDSFEIQ